MKQKNSTPTAKRNRRIRLCMFVSGLSVFAQLYLFQPLLPELCQFFGVEMATSSLAVPACCSLPLLPTRLPANG